MRDRIRTVGENLREFYPSGCVHPDSWASRIRFKLAIPYVTVNPAKLIA